VERQISRKCHPPKWKKSLARASACQERNDLP
jgi:hypothetical protein